MIRAAAPNLDAPIIDIGAGASRLADHLLMAGYSELTLLDLSAVALDSTRQRVGLTISLVKTVTPNAANNHAPNIEGLSAKGGHDEVAGQVSASLFCLKISRCCL